MNRFFTRFTTLFIFAISLFSAKQSLASHAAGADIYYQCLGNNRYKVIAAFYRDCSGIDAPASIYCNVFSACDTIDTQLDEDLIYSQYINGVYVSSGDEVSAICKTSLPQSTCGSGNLKGIRVHFYTTEITVNDGCGIYAIGMSESARNNTNNTQGGNLYVQATLNSDFAVCNSSPVFSSLPVPYYCINKSNSYNQGASDSEGDSLVYTLITPLQDPDYPVVYNPPYSATSPLNTVSGFNFSSNTGQMNFIPSALGDFAIAVRVDEYRDGVFIGSTTRDIQFTVNNCNTSTPIIEGNLSNVSNGTTGATIVDSSSINVCPGTEVYFKVLAAINSGDSVLVTSNVGVAIPDASLTTQYLSADGDSVYAIFRWTPLAKDTGLRYITLTFTPNTCPIATSQYSTYKIYVQAATYAGIDLNYCPSGGPVTVSVSGGSSFKWSPSAGIVSSNSDSSIVKIVPLTSPAQYRVTGNLTVGCRFTDTVVIRTVPSLSLVTTVSDDTLCLNEFATLSVVAGPVGEGPFTYSWTPLAPPQTTSSVVVSPIKNTTYTVAVTSAAGCITKDSARIVVEGVSPLIKILPSSNYVCPGDTVQLNANTARASCGLNPDPSDPCPNCDFEIVTVGTDTTNTPSSGSITGQPTPFRTNYQDARIQYIYRADELNTMGLAGSTITDIAFDLSKLYNSTPHPIENFTIKMGCSDVTQFANRNQGFVPGMSVVYSPATITTFTGWNTFTLSNPYDWDGTSSLIVEICFDQPDAAPFIGGYDYVNSTSVGFNATQIGEANANTGCNLSPTRSPIMLRPNTRFIAASQPLGNYTISWSPSAGLTDPTIFNPKVAVKNNVTYSLNLNDGHCQSNTSITVFIDTAVVVSAGNDTVKCNYDSVQLILKRPTPSKGVCVRNYSMTSIPYAPIPGAGSGTLVTGADQSDDGSGTVQLPFPFNFYCDAYTTAYINANGFLSFTPITANDVYDNQALPDPTEPNNLIAALWDDYDMQGSSRRVEYQIVGTAPNRIFVTRWVHAKFYSGNKSTNFEIQMYETSNVIEVHVDTTTFNSTKTIGVENSDGTNGLGPAGKNGGQYTLATRQAWRFTPNVQINNLVSVQWTPSTGLNVDNNDTVIASPTVATTYVAKATFANGCVNYDTVVVNIGTLPYTLSASKDTICPGDSVTLSFNGRATTYQWSPAGSLNNATSKTPVASPLVTTEYEVKATDSIGCVVKDIIPVAVRNNGLITIGKDTSVCYYEPVILSPSGEPFVSYNWNTADTTSTLNVGTSGDYSVVVRDQFCTYKSDTVSVIVFPQILVRAYSDTSICEGDSVTLLGEPGYSNYEWSTLENTVNITVSDDGTYSYIITDNNNCRQQSNQVTVVVNQFPVLNPVASQDTFCIGFGTLLTAGNEAGVIYTWSLPSMLPQPLVGDTITANLAGTYIVVGNRGGCTSTDSISVASKPSTFPQLGADTTSCGCAGSASLVLSGAVNEPNLTYAWSNSSSSDNTTINASGDYSLTITNQYGCSAADTINVRFVCLLPEITAVPNDTVFEGDTLALEVNNGTYPSATFSYLWGSSDINTISDIHSANPQVAPPGSGQNLYTVSVKDDLYGCVGYDTISIFSIPPTLFIIPTVFSPNGDGVNDYFYPYLPNSQTMQVNLMHIYNRYGQLVYSCTNCNNQLPNAGWDGFYNNASEPIGAYSYFVQIEGPDPSNPVVLKKYFAQGSLSLIK
jgi:gliding motility-associated-like protein